MYKIFKFSFIAEIAYKNRSTSIKIILNEAHTKKLRYSLCIEFFSKFLHTFLPSNHLDSFEVHILQYWGRSWFHVDSILGSVRQKFTSCTIAMKSPTGTEIIQNRAFCLRKMPVRVWNQNIKARQAIT